MSLNMRRRLILICALLIAGILAFPLRDMIYETVVIPAAFIAWNFHLMYRMLSQGIWWWLIISIVFVMLIFSLLARTTSRRQVRTKPKPQLGQVENLAAWLGRAEKGIYFKWLIANRLGKL